jgi:PTS system glucitol/sorbitol-specific IIC component
MVGGLAGGPRKDEAIDPNDRKGPMVATEIVLTQDQPPPAGGSTNPVLNGIIWAGEHFIGLFNEAGKQFAGLITGILPTLIVLLTFMYAMIAFIGEDRVTRAVQWSSRWWITRYTIMPILAVLVLTNPMCYTFGRFLRERHKPAFYDSAVSFVHPVTTFFPYANAGELFVWLGVANGVSQLGQSTVPLAIRYFAVGVVVILIRGVVTELITAYLIRREGKTELFNSFDAAFTNAGAGSVAR